MQESGGRRIKRSLRVDVTSVQFLSEPQIKSLRKAALLTDYIDNRLEEINCYNVEQNLTCPLFCAIHPYIGNIYNPLKKTD